MTGRTTRKTLIISALCTIPHAAFGLSCQGSSPDWALTLTDSDARFQFNGTSEMQIMQDDLSENDQSIRAITLVGPRDSAIAIIADGTTVTVLTQRGQSPIILSGSCD